MSSDNNFTKAMTFVAKWEGIDLTNDPKDRGGKTKYGISDAGDGKRDGLVDIDADGKGDVRVEDLTLEQALQRYHKVYWLGSGADKLLLPLGVCVFDSAVNCGPGRAKQWLKASGGDTKKYIELRRIFYYDISEKNVSQQRFIKGWLNRLNDLSKYVQILATNESS